MVVGASLTGPAEQTNFTRPPPGPHQQLTITAPAKRVSSEHGDLSFTLHRVMLQTRNDAEADSNACTGEQIPIVGDESGWPDLDVKIPVARLGPRVSVAA